MSISLPPELGDNVRAAAQSSGKNLSAWMAEAAGDKLRAEALSAFLDDWEERHGPLTPEEIAKAEAELGTATRETR